MVGSISQWECRREANAVTHVVVEHQLGRETIEFLFDDGTFLTVVTSRDTEIGLLTTTRDHQIVVLAPSRLAHFLHPVGVIVPVLIFCPRAVVVQLVDIRGRDRSLRRIVEFLLHQHSVVVTIQQVVTFRLPTGLYTQRIVYTSLTTRTAFRANHNHTIGTTHTPDGSGGSVFQHLNVLNVLRVHRKQ